MQSMITRLALFQFLIVIYTIVGLGMLLKAFFGNDGGEIPVIFATHLRDYGVLLMILPAAWLTWASVSAHRPRVGTGDLPPILGSGITLVGFLLVLAFFGTMSITIRSSPLVRLKDPPPTPTRIHHGISPEVPP